MCEKTLGNDYGDLDLSYPRLLPVVFKEELECKEDGSSVHVFI